MKKLNLIFSLWLLAFTGLVALAVWSLVRQHPVGALYAGLAAAGTAAGFVAYINRHFRMFRRMLLSIGDNDFSSLGFPKNPFSRHYAAELNRAFDQYKKRERENQLMRLSYEMLLDKTDTAFIIAFPNGDVDWMNKAAVLSLGNLARLDTLDTLCHGFSQAILQAKPGERFVVSFLHNDAKYDMAISTTHMNDRLIVTLQNIRSLLEANELIAWQRLISVLTHEIMNSLTPIISLSDTLMERVQDPGCRQALETIRRRSSGLQTFVENYRKITRVPLPDKTTFPLSDLLADVGRCFPEGTLMWNNQTDTIRLTADRGQMEQVLINLVKNAIEAGTSLPVMVQATIHPFTNNVILTLRDTGSGIEPEVLDKIFIPFFSTKPSGSGIGLSLCKQIIALHGGVLTVTSQVGTGTSFRISLP